MARALYARNFLFPGSPLVQLGATLMPANRYILLVLTALGLDLRALNGMVLNTTLGNCHPTISLGGKIL